MNIQWTFSAHSVRIPWSFSEHSVSIQWTFITHSVSNQSTFSEHSANIHYTFSEHSVNKHSVHIQSTFSEDSVNIQWRFSEDSVNTQRQLLFLIFNFCLNAGSRHTSERESTPKANLVNHFQTKGRSTFPAKKRRETVLRISPSFPNRYAVDCYCSSSKWHNILGFWSVFLGC